MNTSDTSPPRTPWLRTVYFGAALLNALLIVGMSFNLWSSRGATDKEEKTFPGLPQEIDSRWRSLPVQDGRIKPLETASAEIVRQICGRSTFAKQDPVAIVLAWLLSSPNDDERKTSWENESFILCDHHGLRQIILSDGEPTLTDELLHGKYISPAILRSSAPFDQVLQDVAKLRSELQEKAHLAMTTEQLKAEEVSRRLSLYDAVCGRWSTRLAKNAIVNGRFLNVRELSELKNQSQEAVIAETERQQKTTPSPLRIVKLDQANESSWFSLTEVAGLQREPALWRTLLEERFAEQPLAYLRDEPARELATFQQALDQHRAGELLEKLKSVLRSQRKKQVADFDAAFRAQDRDQTNRLLSEMLRTETHRSEFQMARARVAGAMLDDEERHLMSLKMLGDFLAEEDEQRLERLRAGVQAAEQWSYSADSDELRGLKLDYIEAKFPDLYQQASVVQEFPADVITDVMDAFDQLRTAHHARNETEFSRQANLLLTALTTQHGELPSSNRIERELFFNRAQPFRWAWVTMLVTIAILLVSLGLPLRGIYVAALVCYGVSLLVQLVGFVLRVTIAGRAPVANMYETVIFVAFMSGIFALILELVYRRKVIALAGALVATLGLILADQTPLALDPKISPMVPVLRTNFWLTVHVLTIVASYAGGTLAWGLGNISLGIMAFGRGGRDTVKLLAQFTYRAMQIAVLLLAIGTFLGGCWAAESWGRFWGWDPKEVGALIALVCYVIPLHARYVGWVRDFGLAVSAVLCYASIILSWYVLNFLLASGLHSYGFSSGGAWGVLLACLLNIEWVLIATWVYQGKTIPFNRVITEHDDVTNRSA